MPITRKRKASETKVQRMPVKHACIECSNLVINFCTFWNDDVPVDFLQAKNDCEKWEDSLG